METEMRKTTHDIKSERGQTFTEFALVLPIFLVLMLGIVQFGIAFNNYVTLTDAVRAGARKAAVSRSSGDPAGACRAAVLAAGTNLDATELGKNLSCTSSWSPGAEVTVHADYPYDIKLLDWSVYNGRVSSTMKERVE
jgi:Flp pilus assembly protein TadG